MPFCRRSTSRPPEIAPPPEFLNEWICRDHWPLIDKDRRRAYGRRVRRWRRYSPHVLDLAAERLWRSIRRQAIERAAGL